MSGFFLALLACLALIVPGRDGVRVAQLAERLGPGAGLTMSIWLSVLASNALAGWLATLLAPAMPGQARLMFLAFALVLGALELVLRRNPRAPQEPTRSTGAILLVLLASQMTDGARLLVVAVALYTAQPAAAAAGGALASGAVLTLAMLAGGAWRSRLPFRLVGFGVAGLLLALGLYAGLVARGLIV
jgi:putative Ca2+/H+ antiporter (TMEM165/GDT1 family)